MTGVRGRVALLGLIAWCIVPPAIAQYPDWRHRAALFILTTPEGADLPANAEERDFPLLVRLNRDFFDFRQAAPDGADVRLSAQGQPLAYEVEEWDAAQGQASVWVRVPVIRGNTRQELTMHWGKPDAANESHGAAVFNESNGFLSVWHLGTPVTDVVGTLSTTNVGTTATSGIIGPARHLAGDQGLFGGDSITNYPVGSSPHTSEAWIRPDRVNATILAWGNEQAQGKVVMQFRSPPHINMDCYFSDANVASTNRLPLSQWSHVVHSYTHGEARLYVNGVLEAVSIGRAAPLNLRAPARLWLGGWYDRYDYAGDLDEVRISRVARSADWVRLQYENQKPLQTLVGPPVPLGGAFGVAPSSLVLAEGTTATITAQAGGAQKVYWIIQRDGRESVVAEDRLAFTFDAGRVPTNQSARLQFKAIYANGVRTADIPITITEDIPEPVFTLEAPKQWDGRATVEVRPTIANHVAMQAKGAGDLNYRWRVAGLATIHEVAPDRLILTRAQNSGQLTVTLSLSNGGAESTQATAIDVQEPDQDRWVRRTPTADEMPEDNQFYARDDRNRGELFCNGALTAAADSVFLRVFADQEWLATTGQTLDASRTYALSAALKPGLTRYRIEFGAKADGRERILHTATNLVCGDAFLINGQSNALATDTGEDAPATTSDWIRSYGSPPDGGTSERANRWCYPVWKARKGEPAELGYWGMELARRLVESQRVPIFIINGAVGGTRIDQHQRNPANPEDLSSIYGRLLWRVRQARLTHGVRGIIWHQGENDQGADGPTGRYGWETYQQYFVEMSAGWKRDYPNLRHYYCFQIWPRACAMGVNGSDNRLREVQRTLPALYAHMSIISTLGIKPPGGCHYPLAGWAEFARLLQPLIERDHYGKVFSESVTPPNLIRAGMANDANDALVLEFDQPVVWREALASQFYLDGEPCQGATGSVTGSQLTLRLPRSSSARHLTYLDSKSWSPTNLLYGVNGIAALTFCDVPIARPPLRR